MKQASKSRSAFKKQRAVYCHLRGSTSRERSLLMSRCNSGCITRLLESDGLSSSDQCCAVESELSGGTAQRCHLTFFRFVSLPKDIVISKSSIGSQVQLLSAMCVSELKLVFGTKQRERLPMSCDMVQFGQTFETAEESTRAPDSETRTRGPLAKEPRP